MKILGLALAIIMTLATTASCGKSTEVQYDTEPKTAPIQERVVTGKILQLDGDKTYSTKSYYYYKKLGLNAIVKNIPEYKQPKLVYSLLKIYNPDILVITRS